MKTLLAIDRFVIIVFLIFFMQSEQDSTIAQQPSKDVVSPMMKIANTENGDLSMRIDILTIKIRVTGKIAVTTLDFTYMNPNDRILEGEFTFPLGKGQSVSRFALDIGGKLREGVIVDKEKGRIAFEAVERRKVDPGLLEMTEGNNFRARIFPLPAHGTRRIVIAIDQELSTLNNDDLYRLPLMISQLVRKFSVHAEVLKNKVKASSANQLGDLRFREWNETYVADIEKENYIPDEQIAFSFPQPDQPSVFTARRDDNSSWFYVNINPEFEAVQKKLPERIAVVWDNSHSAGNRDITKEILLLDSYIRKAGDLTVELIPFNIEPERSQIYTIRSGNWDELKKALEGMIYDGGTSFGKLDFSRIRTDEILLFSDGLSTFGPCEPATGNVPVYTVNSSLVANHAFLTGISERTSGTYIDLTCIPIAEALNMLENRNFRLLSTVVEEGSAVDIYAPSAVRKNSSYSVAGILIGKKAVINLNFGYNATDIRTVKFTVNADNQADPVILGRVWASGKIAELSLNEEKNKKEITATGKQFGIVTGSTSLIVLETLEDYLQYEIVPPVELRDEYYERLTISAGIKSESYDQHFNRVLERWQNQSQWWKTVFPVKESPVSVVDSDTIAFAEEEAAVYYQLPVVAEEVGDRRLELNEIRMAEVDVEEPVNFEGGAPDLKEVHKQNSGIRINAWDPQTPYLKVLQYSTAGTEYATYLKLKKEYGNTPSFYLDAADFFASKSKSDTAMRILSSLADLKLEVPQLLRVLGSKLMTLKKYDEAILVYEKVLDIKGEEPQSYRDLGLAYEAAGDMQKAIGNLYEVVKRDWDGRFEEIEIIALNEINRILANYPKTDHSFIDDRLIRKQPVDIRVVLTWDTDNCDMDLWVTDPKGEKCFYEHKLTRNGGKISDDFTQGYGPEEFMIRKAIPGEYVVHVNYFGTSSQQVLAPVNLHVTFFTNYGRPDEEHKDVVLRLMNAKEVVEVMKGR